MGLKRSCLLTKRIAELWKISSTNGAQKTCSLDRPWHVQPSCDLCCLSRNFSSHVCCAMHSSFFSWLINEPAQKTSRNNKFCRKCKGLSSWEMKDCSKLTKPEGLVQAENALRFKHQMDMLSEGFCCGLWRHGISTQWSGQTTDSPELSRWRQSRVRNPQLFVLKLKITLNYRRNFPQCTNYFEVSADISLRIEQNCSFGDIET